MSRNSSQLAAQKVGGIYHLVHIAAVRAHELHKGGIPKVYTKNGPVVTALKEVEEGLIGREYLDKIAFNKRW
jgi:DNA-directed RNA polymerase omega subunit